MWNKPTVGLLGLTLILTSFGTLAESESQQPREGVMDQVLKPCEGKKAGDKVVMIDRHGGQHEAICTLAAVPLPE